MESVDDVIKVYCDYIKAEIMKNHMDSENIAISVNALATLLEARASLLRL